MQTIINFGDEEKFKRIEGLDIPFVPKPGDHLIIEGNDWGFKLELEVVNAWQQPNFGNLVVDAKMIDTEQPVPVLDACIWTLIQDPNPWGFYWASGCQAGLANEDVDGTGPLQWGWKFCPGCGAQIIQRRPNDQDL